MAIEARNDLKEKKRNNTDEVNIEEKVDERLRNSIEELNRARTDLKWKTKQWDPANIGNHGDKPVYMIAFDLPNNKTKDWAILASNLQENHQNVDCRVKNVLASAQNGLPRARCSH